MGNLVEIIPNHTKQCEIFTLNSFRMLWNSFWMPCIYRICRKNPEHQSSKTVSSAILREDKTLIKQQFRNRILYFFWNAMFRPEIS